MERQAPRSLQINELHNIPPLFLPEIAPTVQSQDGGAFRGVSQGGLRRQKLSRFFLPAFLESKSGGGELFPVPEAQFIELSQITVHPDRSLAAIDQS